MVNDNGILNLFNRLPSIFKAAKAAFFMGKAMTATSEQIAAMLDYAAQAGAREACGLVLDSGRVYPCRNLADDPEHFFRIDPAGRAAAEQLGRVVGIWHSHPYGTAEPSLIDRAMCERSGLPWHVVSHPGGDYRHIAPSGWRADYLGRPYCYGVFDCWELVRDWYARERGLSLPRPNEPDGWEERGLDLFTTAAEAAGFIWVDDEPQAGDVLLMQIRGQRPNHVAVWLGDGRILHHLRDRQSETHIYGGWWQRVTVRRARIRA
ncbi:peptidase P60 [Chromobacterium vaccinii]|uniref:C40 family peptidase n=1 Tax=Chromobacterium vaccinii TaxID=1108595 RepID=UPI000CE9A4E8|nr:C40 family peptidase [Chromobacterium vaccinii]AVG16336.1 peptidase P60 [Chromobacterium vaccinii]